jgi:AAA domain
MHSGRLPPVGWRAFLGGWWNYRRTSSTRERLREDGLKAIPGPLPHTIARDLKSTQYKTWASRPAVERSEQVATLVTGAVGTGKTAFLNELLRQSIPHSDIVILLDSSAVRLALDAHEPGLLWEKICEHLRFSTPASAPRMSATGIAYALTNRRILLVIEDIHGASDSARVLELLRNYFERHHRWSPRLKILLSTREPQPDTPSPLGPDVNLIQLLPLTGNEPREYFYELCQSNGIHIHESTAVLEALSTAFSTEITRTPLFIVMCAWLVTSVEEYRRDLTHLLQMNRSQVIRKFTEELYERRTPKAAGPSRDLVLRAYQELAFGLWPEWRQIEDRTVAETLGRLAADAAVPVSFFENNGFLYRPRELFGSSRMSFPHQAIADFLAAKAMVEAGDFAQIRSRYAPTRLEGFVEFLAELTDTQETLAALARDELAAFVRVAAIRQDLLRRSDTDRERLVRESAVWATSAASRHQEVETWVAFRELFQTVWSPWREQFCEVVRAAGESQQGIEALASIDGRQSRLLLDQWLSASDLAVFRAAAQTEPTQRYVIDVLNQDGIQNVKGWNALRIAWSTNVATLRDAARHCLIKHLEQMPSAEVERSHNWNALEFAWLAENDPDLRLSAERWVETFGPYQDHETLSRIIDFGPPAIERLARGSENVSVELKQRLSYVVAFKLSKVLVPAGEYSVHDNGVLKRAPVKTPFLVPCDPQIVVGPFSPDEADEKIRKLARDRFQQIMTAGQGKIVYQLFSDKVLSGPWGNRGAKFPESDGIAQQVLRTSATRVGFFDITDQTAGNLNRFGFPTTIVKLKSIDALHIRFCEPLTN